MTKTNTNAEQILSTLNPEAAAILSSHFRHQIAAELAGDAPKPVARRTSGKAKVEHKRQKSSDGRNASQFVRDYDAANGEDSPASAVVEAAKEVGLNLTVGNVYSARQNARKKAGNGLVDPEVKQARRERALAIARAARAAKREPKPEKADPKPAKPAKPAKKPAKK